MMANIQVQPKGTFKYQITLFWSFATLPTQSLTHFSLFYYYNLRKYDTFLTLWVRDMIFEQPLTYCGGVIWKQVLALQLITILDRNIHLSVFWSISF